MRFEPITAKGWGYYFALLDLCWKSCRNFEQKQMIHPSQIRRLTMRQMIDLRFKPNSKEELRTHVNDYIDNLPEFFDSTDVVMQGHISIVEVKAHKNYTGEVPTFFQSEDS